MITSRSQFYESQISGCVPKVLEPELELKLYNTFLEIRDLLEKYAPSWYSDELQEGVESIVKGW